MAGVRRKAQPNGKYVAWYIDAAGKQRFFTGTRQKGETLRMAERLEDEHRQVRLGYRPAPKAPEKHKGRSFGEVAGEYLAWGESQGGRGGRPWSTEHASTTRALLSFWGRRLGLQTLADLDDDLLRRVEAILRELQDAGRSGKTLTGYAACLKTLCNWAVKRGYLAKNPLGDLGSFDKTPTTIRRALTVQEIQRLLDVAPDHRRLLYEVAFTSGLRAGELRSLSVSDLDTEQSGLWLDATWTKNRKPAFQPLPKTLVERLRAFAESGKPLELYCKGYARHQAGMKGIPANPLLYVSSHPARQMDEDLAAAGIVKNAVGGKVDFHACRNAYLSLVIEAGASVKEAQVLGRHSTPTLTLNTYSRARESRLSELAEAVGNMLEPKADHALCMHRQAIGAEGLNVSAIRKTELRLSQSADVGGSNPPAPTKDTPSGRGTSPAHFVHKP